MKHIKIFEEFDKSIVTEDNLQDLADIFDEVKDMGYTFHIKERGPDGYQIMIELPYSIDMTYYNSQRPRCLKHDWSELREYVVRAMEYITGVIGTREISLFINGEYKSQIDSIDSSWFSMSKKNIKHIDILFNWGR